MAMVRLAIAEDDLIRLPMLGIPNNVNSMFYRLSLPRPAVWATRRTRV
jgi:hypothetical protein